MAGGREVKVPDIGDFDEVPIIEILVSEGDEVSEEDPLVTLESDKATMDVPAPFAGTVDEIKVEVGDKVSEGTVIMVLGGGDADDGGGDEKPDVEAEEQAGPKDGGDRPDDGDGDIGQAADEKTGGAGAEPGADSAEAAESSDAGDGDEATKAAQRSAGEASDAGGDDDEGLPPARGYGDVSASGDDAPADAGPHASPGVRRLARELGVELADVKGSGRKGRVTKEDLRRHLAGGQGGGGATLGLPAWPQVDFEKFGEVERVELPRIRRISGPNVHRNWVMIPHVTQHDEADITDLESFRKQLNSEQDRAKVTMVALLVKASVAALKEFPEFNASLDGDELVLKRYWHIGFAADTPGGLVVPVIRDADRKGLIEIAAELRELSGRAREGKLKSAEMQGGTFTISSLGGIGGTAFTPIVNAPEVAILGVSRSQTRPVWDGSQFVPRLMLPLSLSYDHRIIDGAAAARFTAHLAGVLSDLRRVLL